MVYEAKKSRVRALHDIAVAYYHREGRPITAQIAAELLEEPGQTTAKVASQLTLMEAFGYVMPDGERPAKQEPGNHKAMLKAWKPVAAKVPGRKRRPRCDKCGSPLYHEGH